MSESEQDNSATSIETALKSGSREELGVVNSSFLLESIGGLTRKQPLCVDQDLDVQTAVEQLVAKKVGCALLVDKNSVVIGIFTERDYLKHFAPGEKDSRKLKIKEVSTMEPMTVPPDTTIAYALNLMSHGKFRHLPVVDESGKAIGVVSVRDILDRISELLVQDLMSF